jgi:hypothetical protein
MSSSARDWHLYADDISHRFSIRFNHASAWGQAMRIASTPISLIAIGPCSDF